MRKFIQILTLILLYSCTLTGQDRLSFDSENEFKSELTGSWILKSYRDSILKGCTPFDLQDLLINTHGFFYNPSKKYSNVFPNDSSYWIFIDSKKNFINEGLAIELDKQLGRIIKKEYSNDYDSKNDKWIDNYSEPEQIGFFRLIKLDNEVVLDLKYKDDSVVLVKGDYEKLLNKTFIAGEYKFNNSITVQFDTNGQIKNLEKLDKSFKNIDIYEIGIGYFAENKDCIYFGQMSSKMKIPFNWTLKHDTLELISTMNKSIKYELIKSTPYNTQYSQ